MTPEEKEIAIENRLSKIKDIEQFYVAIKPKVSADIVETPDNYNTIVNCKFEWGIVSNQVLSKTDQRYVYLLQSFCVQMVRDLITNNLIVNEFNPNQIDQSKIEKLNQVKEDMIGCLSMMDQNLFDFVRNFEFNKPTKLKIKE